MGIDTGIATVRHGAIAPCTIAAPYLFRALRAAVEMGARKPALLERLAIDERALANPLSRFASQLMPRLLNAAAEDLGNPALALDMRLNFRPRNFSDIGFGSMFCATVGQAIAQVIERQPLQQTVCSLEMDVEGPEVRLFLRLLGDDPDVMARFIEVLTASNLRSMWQLAGGELGLRHIAFQHQPPPYAVHYGLTFGAPVEFGARETVAIIRADVLDRPVPRPDPLLAAAVEQRSAALFAAHSHVPGPAGLCALYCLSELDKSPVTLARAAQVFGTTERSLRRRLREEGTTFREIVESIRRELCELYRLEGRRSVGEIALLLGYSDTSAFTRAHSGWHGLPPSRAHIRPRLAVPPAFAMHA